MLQLSASVYAPTITNLDENKEIFYNQLANVLSRIPRTDELLMIGDLFPFENVTSLECVKKMLIKVNKLEHS